jgi:hypothetical protein
MFGEQVAVEPLHVPPPPQRRFVHRIHALSTQTFFSTHSPMVAALSGPQVVTMLRNDADSIHRLELVFCVVLVVHGRASTTGYDGHDPTPTVGVFKNSQLSGCRGAPQWHAGAAGWHRTDWSTA